MSLQEYVNQNGGVIAIAAGVVVSLNLALTGISAALDKAHGLIPGEADEKLNIAVKGLIGLLQKVIDALGFNPKH